MREKTCEEAAWLAREVTSDVWGTPISLLWERDDAAFTKLIGREESVLADLVRKSGGCKDMEGPLSLDETIKGERIAKKTFQRELHTLIFYLIPA